MQNIITHHCRAFEVTVEGPTGETTEELLVLDKSQLQAAQIVGQSSKELIKRICARQGFKLLNVGEAPHKYPLTVDLTELYAEANAIDQ